MFRRRSTAVVRRVALLSLLAGAGFTSVQLAAAAAPAAPAAAPAAAASPAAAPTRPQAASGVRWNGRRYTSLVALRRAVTATGADWERFLHRHPSVPRVWGLARVAWDGGFYTRTALARTLRRRGVTYATWAKGHPAAAATLHRNAAVRFAPTVARRTEASSGALAPVADTYFDSAAPTQAFGSAGALAVESGPKATRLALLRFALPQLSGTVAKATLSLHASGKGGAFTVVPATPEWSESSTYATRPAIAGSPSAAFTTRGTGWVDVDVTALVGGSVVELAVTGGNKGAAASFGSRESSSVPRLVVDVTPPPATTTTPTTTTTSTTTTTPTTTTTQTTTTTPTTTTTTTTTETPAPSPKSRVGVSSGGTLPWYSDTDLARELDGYGAIGASWLRFDLHWTVVERNGKGTYDWSLYDRLVDRATARGLNLLAIIAYSPAWARNAACAGSDKCEPANPQDYADFAAAAVRRYAPRGVKHYELWNEPNIRNFWQPAPSAPRYAALVRAAYPRMKAVDPTITVLAGATSPASNDGTNVDPRTFLQGVYSNGGGGNFDAWSHHPYYGPNRPADPYEWSAWYQMYGTKPSLRSLMEANGDGAKKLWATETGSLVGVTWSCCGTTTEGAQADLLREAFDLWLSYPWAGGLMYYNYHSHDGWSLTREDWSLRPAWYAYRDYPRR